MSVQRIQSVDLTGAAIASDTANRRLAATVRAMAVKPFETLEAANAFGELLRGAVKKAEEEESKAKAVEEKDRAHVRVISYHPDDAESMKLLNRYRRLLQEVERRQAALKDISDAKKIDSEVTVIAEIEALAESQRRSLIAKQLEKSGKHSTEDAERVLSLCTEENRLADVLLDSTWSYKSSSNGSTPSPQQSAA